MENNGSDHYSLTDALTIQTAAVVAERKRPTPTPHAQYMTNTLQNKCCSGRWMQESSLKHWTHITTHTHTHTKNMQT